MRPNPLYESESAKLRQLISYAPACCFVGGPSYLEDVENRLATMRDLVRVRAVERIAAEKAGKQQPEVSSPAATSTAAGTPPAAESTASVPVLPTFPAPPATAAAPVSAPEEGEEDEGSDMVLASD